MSSKEYVLDAKVKEYLEHVQEEGAAKVTCTGYRWIIHTATEALRRKGLETDPAKWTRQEVNYIRNELFAGQKNGVRRRHMAVLNTYLKWHGNPVIEDMRIKWPQDEKMPPDHLSVRQSLEVMDAAVGMERMVVHLELNLGLRRVEVLRLRPESFKLDHLSVQGKGRGGGKWRTVPYHEDTGKELAAYKRLREEEIARARGRNPQVRIPHELFIYERGGNLYAYQKTAMDNLVKKVAARTGIPFSNHTLRRTYGRTLWEMNRAVPGSCPIETIAWLMGHVDTKTTIKYLGIDLSDAAGSMSALGRFQNMVRSQSSFPRSILVGSGQSGI